MDFDNPSTDLQQKVANHIQKSGFPFEWEVRDCLQRSIRVLPDDFDYEIEFHGFYLDPEEDKPREIDISSMISRNSETAPHVIWTQYFECKQSDKASWIFFTEPRDKNAWTAGAVNLAYLQIIPAVFKHPDETLGDSIYYGRSTYHANSFTTYPDNSDMIRTAVYQVLKPLYAEFTGFLSNIKDDGDQSVNTVLLYFPIIVFSGYMFEYRYTDTGAQLTPAKHVLLRVKLDLDNRKSPRTYLVDIVRADYLPEFLEQHFNDYKLLHNFIDSAKPECKPLTLKWLETL